LEREKERLSSELSEASFKLEELEKVYQTNITKVKDLESKLKTISSENEKFETERRTWKEKDREGEMFKVLLEQKVLQLDAKFKTADFERKDLKGKVFALQDEVSDLEFQLDSRKSEVSSLEAQVKILSEKYEKSLDENSRVNGELGDLKMNLESNLRDMADRDEEIKHLTDTKTRVESEMVFLKETMFSDKNLEQKQQNKGLKALMTGAMSLLPGGNVIRGLAGINPFLQNTDFAQATSLADYLDMQRYGGAQGRADAAARNMAQTRGIQKKIDSGMYNNDNSGITDRGRGQNIPSAPKAPQKTSSSYTTASQDRRKG